MSIIAVCISLSTGWAWGAYSLEWSRVVENLRALREPDLQGSKVEAYRLVVLRSFEHPFSVRISVLPSGVAFATVRATNGRGGYSAGTLSLDRVVALTQDQFARVRAAMGERFVAIATDLPHRDERGELIEHITCSDGSSLALEAVSSRGYHRVARLCVYEDALVDAMQAFRPFYPPGVSDGLLNAE
jgi:hypothetical protein